MSGRMCGNLSDALCPGNANPANHCDYQVNSAAVYYVWQTGPGSWNQFTGLKDSSANVVHFDAPPNVNFTVPAGAAFGAYAGTTVVLQRNGFGGLSGIPDSCVSESTNARLTSRRQTPATSRSSSFRTVRPRRHSRVS